MIELKLEASSPPDLLVVPGTRKKGLGTSSIIHPDLYGTKLDPERKGTVIKYGWRMEHRLYLTGSRVVCVDHSARHGHGHGPRAGQRAGESAEPRDPAQVYTVLLEEEIIHRGARPHPRDGGHPRSGPVTHVVEGGHGGRLAPLEAAHAAGVLVGGPRLETVAVVLASGHVAAAAATAAERGQSGRDGGGGGGAGQRVGVVHPGRGGGHVDPGGRRDRLPVAVLYRCGII